MNDAVFSEYRRITGCSDPLRFPHWWAERVREVVRLQLSEVHTQADLHLASARWARLSRQDQQERLLAYLRGLPMPYSGALPESIASLIRQVA